MKIKVFIVTYNCDLIYNNIRSLLSSDLVNYDYSINVIDNYCENNDLIDFCKDNNINLFENKLRPSFSTGHLSRSWNQCIINGFKDLNNPDCDILVLCQDDNLFLSSWCSELISYHDTYEFISMGAGDQLHSYKPEHIKKVGLWDERFCNIGYQEYDYFIRSYVYNRDNSSINDRSHGRVYNKLGDKFIDHSSYLIGGMRNDKRHLSSLMYHEISKNILIHKWGQESLHNTCWDFEYLNSINKCNIENYIYYPYFEKDIYDLKGKNYLI
jgi:hypothetical protein